MDNPADMPRWTQFCKDVLGEKYAEIQNGKSNKKPTKLNKSKEPTTPRKER